jgi:WD40 repeat protein
MIWDDNQISCIGELRFPSEVRSVKLRRDKVLVALDNSVHVYKFHPLDVECVLETGENLTGMLAVCPTAHVVVATIAKSPGVVSLHNLSADKGFLVTCHNTPITCLAVSNDGALLATASERGTLIRVYDAATSEKVKEVRRGSQHAIIYSLSFSPDQRFVACGSDTGTIHIFAVQGEGTNQKGSFSFMAGVSGYFGSEWSFAKYHSASLQGRAVIVTFAAEPGKLLAVTSDCQFLLLRFDPVAGGVMTAEKIVTFPSGADSA